MDIKFYARDREEFGFLSNFAIFPIEINGEIWETNEHYYQAQKVDPKHPEAKKHKSRFRTGTPGQAKRLGRRVPLRPDWDEIKDSVMMKAVWAKFRQHDQIRERLLATGNAELIEDSPRDKYWGSGKDGTGKNMLGRILMQVRKELRDE